MAKQRRNNARQSGYSRTDRVGERLREIIGNELERIGDERLDLVTITNVDLDNDTAYAKVFYSALIATDEGRIDEVADAFEDVRWTVQKLVNRTVTTRRTPKVVFIEDNVLNDVLRIDDIVAGRVNTFDDDFDD